MIKISKALKIRIIIAVVAVLVCFVIAIKALSSITTTYFDNTYIVCLDPGHGGDDAGAVSGDRKEKDDNLRLALLVKQELENLDVQVVMTREDDTEVELKKRCKTANKARADLFVSLHRNSADSASGMEVWIKDKPERKERSLAKDILRELSKVTSLPERGVKKGFRDSTGNNYYVNANTNMPSCLVEVGFISNETDNLDFDKNIEKYAEAIALGIYENL